MSLSSIAEPIYMNTQELAAKIAARKKMEEEDNQQSVSQSVSSDNRPPTTRDEERKVGILFIIDLAIQGAGVARVTSDINW